MTNLRRLALLSFVALAALGSWAGMDYQRYLDSPVGEPLEGSVLVQIARGSFDAVTKQLEDHELIDSPRWFTLHATLSDKARKVKAGTYLVDTQWTPRQLLDYLVDGNAATRRLTVIPGHTIWHVAERVEQAGIGTRDEFLRAASDVARARALGLPLPASDKVNPRRLPPVRRSALEGYLQPGTYAFDWNATVDDVVEVLAQSFLYRWRELTKTHAERYAALRARFELDDDQLVTLASIVERESILDEERALVAGVFYNRMRDGWRLQTDPTLTYTPESYRDRPTPRHRKDKSNPYNTYAHDGLPPGPISNPSVASLEAVLAPEDSDFMFFVALGKGSKAHTFSKTYDEHRENVRKMRQSP